MKIVCLSLGGSIVSRENGLNVDYLVKLRNLVKRHSKDTKFIIVVGGGYTSKVYVQSGRKAIKSDYLLDWVGISVTRANAEAVKAVLYDTGVHPWLITDIREVKQAIDDSGVVLMGGLMPGITTDACAVLAAEASGSSTLINVSKVNYVYDRNPDDKGAKQIERMDYERLIEIATKFDTREARSHFIFDVVAARLARRSKIKLIFTGDKIEDLEASLNGKARGTVVV